MFRIGLALQPVATALVANSPFREGRPNGYLSFRSRIWTPTRTGRDAAVRLRGRFRLRALGRLHPRRADVLRLPAWPLHRRFRPVVP
ncbi:MAG: glutamate-cysteine ligase family protein [Rhodospirillales bacterium]